MRLLSILSPAETMLVIDSSCSLKDMMKFTFMDLLLKKVIEIKVEKKKVITRDKYAKKIEAIKSYNYVIKGKNFDKYTQKTHELIYLSPFNKSSSIKILFKHLIKMAYENARGASSFKKAVLKSKNINGLVKVNFLQQIFGGISLTKEGTKTKQEILNYLKPIDESIADLLNDNKKKALELLLSLGGNIFLLKNLDFTLLKTIDRELLKEQKSAYEESHDSGLDWWYYFDFYDGAGGFDSYFGDFDNTIDSFNSDFDSAGSSSGDNGCSSCSGCGGCGGCD